eukprot:6803041-Prymnesium_polylepis.1
MSDAAALYRSLAAGGWREQARAAAARFRRKFQPVDVFRRADIFSSLGLRVPLASPTARERGANRRTFVGTGPRGSVGTRLAS